MPLFVIKIFWCFHGLQCRSLPIVNCSDVEIRNGELHWTYYIPLVSQNLDDPSYISCASNQFPEAAEFVVNSSQTLPRFQVDLAIIEPEHLFQTYTTERLHTAAATGQLSVSKDGFMKMARGSKRKMVKEIPFGIQPSEAVSCPFLVACTSKIPSF